MTAKKLLPLSLFFAALPVFGQQSAPATIPLSEKIAVQPSNTAFVSGETVHYKIYCTDGRNNPSQLSKVVYLSLVSEEKKAVLTQKLWLENGTANGDFFIPTTLNSGMYKLVAFTKWMVGKPASSLSQTDIAIANPYMSGKTASGRVPILFSKNNTSEAVSTSKKTYSRREKITLATKLDPKGNYSVSVRLKDSLSGLIADRPRFTEHAFSLSQNALPELRGETLSGKVTANGVSLEDVTVSLSIPDKDFTIKIVRPKSDGSFFFTLDQPTYGKNVIVQAAGPNRDKISVTLDPIRTPDFSSLEFREYPVNSFLKNTLKQHSVATQIQNAYFAHHKDSLRPFPPIKSFYAGQGTVFKLDDYTRFPTVAETLTEVVEESYYTKNADKYSIHVREHIQGYDSTGESLVIVDGIWLPDPTELFDYPAKNIEKFTVIPGWYYLGPKGFNGVVSVQTKTGNYAPKAKGSYFLTEEVPRPLAPKDLFSPDYAANPEARIPDYRYQLVWIPILKGDSVSFYASDVTGTFEVVTEGLNPDGSTFFAASEFEVK